MYLLIAICDRKVVLDYVFQLKKRHHFPTMSSAICIPIVCMNELNGNLYFMQYVYYSYAYFMQSVYCIPMHVTFQSAAL